MGLPSLQQIQFQRETERARSELQQSHARRFPQANLKSAQDKWAHKLQHPRSTNGRADEYKRYLAEYPLPKDMRDRVVEMRRRLALFGVELLPGIGLDSEMFERIVRKELERRRLHP